MSRYIYRYSGGTGFNTGVGISTCILTIKQSFLPTTKKFHNKIEMESELLMPTAAGAESARYHRRILFRSVGIAFVVVIAVATFAHHQTPATTAHVRSSIGDAHFAGATDAIVGLPGMPATYSSRLFAGYLPIHSGVEGFYFLAESQSDTPATDPVLLWLNGGPGASSLAGCFSENGPLIVNPDGATLRVNDFAWNMDTNLLCIESPIGVGFSYNASHIYKSDDDAQADDLYWMLQAFYDKFPWLRANDFIIAGESYAGVYVPMTAKRIVDGNIHSKATTNNTSAVINLTKFAVGNGVNEFAALSKIAFAYYHALISTEDYQHVISKCPQLLAPEAKSLLANPDAACQQAIGEIGQQLLTSGVNNYDITAPCSGHPLDGIPEMIETLQGPLQQIPHPIAMTATVCLNWTELISYFNRPATRAALHAKPQITHWNNNALTSSSIDVASLLNISNGDQTAEIITNKMLEYRMTQQAVTHVWKYLLDNGVEGVIYHGDTDMACDFISGLWAVESLELPRQQRRRTWKVVAGDDDQVAGFVEDFGMIKYVTVRGSGHMVPKDKPQAAKAMLDQFVLGKS